MCKGTTNWEDVYIIDINIIPEETLGQLNYGWVKNHGGIPVDECIGKEVEDLVIQGVVTVGSCCGHERWNAHILTPYSEKDKLEKLGYQTKVYNDFYLWTNLKTGTQV